MLVTDVKGGDWAGGVEERLWLEQASGAGMSDASRHAFGADTIMQDGVFQGKNKSNTMVGDMRVMGNLFICLL